MSGQEGEMLPLDDNLEMRRELFFSRGGPYADLLRSNVLLHREAADSVARIISERLDAPRRPSRILRWLDLGCGGLPVTPGEVMARHSERRFSYVGVDINPDQIALARQFPFSENVVEVELVAGSGWDLDHLSGRLPFDVVYVGLNWHHGTPEEIWFLASAVRALLATDGLLVNHDCLRPQEHQLLRRPPALDGDPAQPTALVAPETLALSNVPAFGFAADTRATTPEWKLELIERLTGGFVDRGGGREGADEIVRHMHRRDFPVSAAELRVVLESASYEVEQSSYDRPDEPLDPYLRLTVAASSP